jgi:hypothetical protein
MPEPTPEPEIDPTPVMLVRGSHPVENTRL